MSRFKILTETLADIHYWDNKEVEQIIEAHFKMWLNTEIQNNVFGKMSDVRQELIEQRQALLQKRQAIECQLLIAKSDLRLGKQVDTTWMARLNWAGKMTGAQLVYIQDQLTHINSAEKKINVETSMTEDRIVLDQVRQYLFDLLGDKEQYKNIMKGFSEKARAIMNTPGYVYESKNNS